MQQYLIATFYKFVALEHYESLKPLIMKAMTQYEIKGTLILASEGINGTVAGLEQNIVQFFHVLNEDLALKPLTYQKTYDDSIPFSKAKIKLRKEIVTMGVEQVNPNENPGTHVSPDAWNELIADPEVLVIDTRNEYEVSLGTFDRALNPDTLNFRDFPDYVETELAADKKKKIAMFCTGGIRCEKSTAYLKQMGFEEVYQLQGGILNYLQSTPAEQSRWKGACFVFDDRLALDANLTKLPEGIVDKDWKHKNRHREISKKLC